MTQREVVLGLLRQAGDQGVSVHDLVYRRGITRAAAIIHGLRHDEGLDIETIPGEPLPDGRVALARYRLRPERFAAPMVMRGHPQEGCCQRCGEPWEFGHRCNRSTSQPEPESLPLAPAQALPFDCGCVRAADGRSWQERCDGHK